MISGTTHPYMKQRIFVFEFITGGGLADRPLPASLLREGSLMLDALLRDAGDLPDTEVVTLRDARLPGLEDRAIRCKLTVGMPECITVASADDFEAGFDAALDRCDAAIVLAPETGGVLASLVERVEASGRRLLGCDTETCRITGSKSRAADLLAENCIAVLPHYVDPDRIGRLTGTPGRWVVKPDDGAGCDGLQIVNDHLAAARTLLARGAGHIAQPWFDGEAQSMNLLCARGEAVLLSVNRQYLRHDGERVWLAALGVGEVTPDGRHAALAARIAAALPGLLGHVGVDLLHTDDGALVVEINPRFSTSACALRSTLGLNLLAATLAAARGQPLPQPRAGIGSMNIDLANLHTTHDEIF